MLQRTYLRSHRIDGGVPIHFVTGDTVDTSGQIEHGFYNRVWYRDNAGLDGGQKPGRRLGVSENVDSIMSSWIL